MNNIILKQLPVEQIILLCGLFLFVGVRLPLVFRILVGGNDGEIFNAVVYETLDGNEIPAISSGEPYELLRRNLENDGYDFVGISQLAADINAYNYNQGFNQF